MHLGLAGLLHFVRNDGKGVVNYGSISSGMASRSTSSFIRRRSRRGNPDGLKKCILSLAGLLHFVRNDGKGVVNYGSINSGMASCFIITSHLVVVNQ